MMECKIRTRRVCTPESSHKNKLTPRRGESSIHEQDRLPLETPIHSVGREHPHKNIVIAGRHIGNLETDVVNIWVEGIHPTPHCAGCEGNVTLVRNLPGLLHAQAIICLDGHRLDAVQLETACADIRQMPKQFTACFVGDAHVI